VHVSSSTTVLLVSRSADDMETENENDRRYSNNYPECDPWSLSSAAFPASGRDSAVLLCFMSHCSLTR
jgi:hypothetical protein